MCTQPKYRAVYDARDGWVIVNRAGKPVPIPFGGNEDAAKDWAEALNMAARDKEGER